MKYTQMICKVSIAVIVWITAYAAWVNNDKVENVLYSFLQE